MVKFDLNLMLYLEREDFRVLTAVETGMRNHQIVPAKLVGAIAELRNGTSKILRNLCYNRLISYERGKKFDGYRLTNLGYDYLALRVLKNKGLMTEVGNQIGVGKEASVYIARNSETGDRYALKVHRLGKTSFKTVYSKRDYHKNKVGNWLYLSRLAAIREFSFLKALYEKGFNVPKPIDNNRHCVVMQWIDGTLLNNISSEDNINFEKLLNKLLDMILDLANKYGLVHGDFNEFNILIDNATDEPILIDFPQMVSTDHKLAKMYFERDVNCIINFFEKRFNCFIDEIPTFEDLNLENEPEEHIQIKEDEDGMLSRFLNQEFSNKNDLDKIEQIDINQDNNINDIKEKYLNQIIKNMEELGYNKKTDHQISNKNNQENHTEIENNQENNKEDLFKDNLSVFSYSNSKLGSCSILSNFTSEDIKNRLKKEKVKKEKKELLKKLVRNVKGESNAILRKKKQNLSDIKEDATVWDLF